MSVELEVLQQQLGTKKSHLITEETVEELNKLIDDPDYGEEFLDAYISYFNILDKNSVWSTPKYMNAMKFFLLLESGHNQVDAYVKVFPDRLKARIERGEDKSNMGGEASRYNASALVNEIKKVAGQSVKLIHRNLFHEMIMQQADLAFNARSEAVRQKAGETLIRELKPDEAVELQVEVSHKHSVIDEYEQAMLKMVEQQQELIASGGDLKSITNAKIKVTETIDVEIDEE